MNYNKIYTDLLERAKHRKKIAKDADNYVYYEKHHIIPKCMGGSDERSNLVYLTAEEHWLAHLLLVKMNPGVFKLVYACQAMSMSGKNNPGRVTNKLFGWIRRAYSEASSKSQKGKIVSTETREKISKALKGRPAVHQQGENNVAKRPEVARKISESNAGKKAVFTDPVLRGKRISAGKKGKPNLPGELNPSFKGWTIATPINGGPEIRMSGPIEMRLNGFKPASVYNCLNGRNRKHKGYIFQKEHITKTVDK